MKIMFVSWAFPPNYTGIGSYTANMASALTECGHDVVVATGKVSGMPDEEKTEYGLVLRCFDQHEIGTRKLADTLLTIAANKKIDLIECAEFLGEGSEMLRKTNRPPILIKAHNSGPVRVGRESEIHYRWQRWTQWAAILRNWRQYRNELYSLKHGDMLLTPSGRLMDELARQFAGLPPVRTVLPNPITLPENPPTFNESARPTLLFVGRLAIGKGIAYLPGIMQTLVRKYPDLQLVIAGGDSYARGIGSLQQWLGRKTTTVKDNIIFTGHLNRDQLSKQYNDSWIVIVPSRWDTFPTVVLEAMGHAKPVVTSLNGGMPEMLGQTLCRAADLESDEFAEVIDTLLSDKDLRKKSGLSMFAKAKTEYNPQIIARKYTFFVKEYLETH